MNTISKANVERKIKKFDKEFKKFDEEIMKKTTNKIDEFGKYIINN
jgi:hypothetical protein